MQAQNKPNILVFLVYGCDLGIQLQGKINAARNTTFLNRFPNEKHRSSCFTSLFLDRWKISYHYSIEKPVHYELYELEEDPFERVNSASSYTEKLKEMFVFVQKQLHEKKALYPEKEENNCALKFQIRR